MAASVMMALGDFRFTLATATPQAVESSADWSWAEQSNIGGFPDLQHTAKGAPTKAIRGSIFPQFRGGFDQIERMIEMADKGVPLTLVSSNGQVLGDWVILSIGSVETIFDRNGVAKKIDFALNIKRYAI